MTARKVDLMCKDCGVPLTDDERERRIRICDDCRADRDIDKEEQREARKQK